MRVDRIVPAILLSALLPLNPVLALPAGYKSVEGNVRFSKPSASTLQVRTNAQRSIVNYKTFDIGASETVRFLLPNRNAAILNRVTGGDSSSIMGQLLSNGQVFLINPHGILFGPDSTVNVGSLMATTLNITNSDFLKGNLVFTRNPASIGATVRNGGTIITGDNGYAILAGSAVQNTGNITSPGGQIHLAVGDTVSMHLHDQVLVDLTVDKALQQKLNDLSAAVENAGTLDAEGGLVKMQAQLAEAFYAKTINNTGEIRAQSATMANGKVVLTANSGSVSHSGTISVSGTTDAPDGGTVYLSGSEVIQSGTILAEANEGGTGGEIRLNSTGKTSLEAGSIILARSAAENGNAGEIVIWSDGDTHFKSGAVLDVSGGSTSGDGGFVEVSGQKSVYFNGTAYGGATNGRSGSILIDPLNIIVDVGGLDAVSGGDAAGADESFGEDAGLTLTFDPLGGGAFNGFGAIHLQATNDITIDGDFDTSIASTGAGGTPVKLTLEANNDININARITTTNADINLFADADSNNGGDINLAAGIVVESLGGDITLTGNNLATGTGSSINTLGGNFTATVKSVDINGDIRTNSPGDDHGLLTLKTPGNRDMAIGDNADSDGDDAPFDLNATELANISAFSSRVQIGSNNGTGNLDLLADIDATENGLDLEEFTLATGGDLNMREHTIRMEGDDEPVQFNIDAGGDIFLGRILGNGFLETGLTAGGSILNSVPTETNIIANKVALDAGGSIAGVFSPLKVDLTGSNPLLTLRAQGTDAQGTSAVINGTIGDDYTILDPTPGLVFINGKLILTQAGLIALNTAYPGLVTDQRNLLDPNSDFYLDLIWQRLYGDLEKIQNLVDVEDEGMNKLNENGLDVNASASTAVGNPFTKELADKLIQQIFEYASSALSPKEWQDYMRKQMRTIGETDYDLLVKRVMDAEKMTPLSRMQLLTNLTYYKTEYLVDRCTAIAASLRQSNGPPSPEMMAQLNNVLEQTAKVISAGQMTYSAILANSGGGSDVTQAKVTFVEGYGQVVRHLTYNVADTVMTVMEGLGKVSGEVVRKTLEIQGEYLNPKPNMEKIQRLIAERTVILEVCKGAETMAEQTGELVSHIGKSMVKNVGGTVGGVLDGADTAKSNLATAYDKAATQLTDKLKETTTATLEAIAGGNYEMLPTVCDSCPEVTTTTYNGTTYANGWVVNNTTNGLEVTTVFSPTNTELVSTLPPGSSLSNAGIRFADGYVLKSDGTLIDPQGNVKSTDGTWSGGDATRDTWQRRPVIFAEYKPELVTVTPHSEFVHVKTEDGLVVYERVLVTRPNQIIKEQKVMKYDPVTLKYYEFDKRILGYPPGTKFGSDNKLYLPDETIILPNGTRVDKEGTRHFINGAYLQKDGTLGWEKKTVYAADFRRNIIHKPSMQKITEGTVTGMNKLVSGVIEGLRETVRGTIDSMK